MSAVILLGSSPLLAKATGYLNITKNTTNNIDASFGFTITNSTTSSSSKSTTIKTLNGTASKQIELDAGTYTVTENALGGWDLTSATCDNGTVKSNGVSGVLIENDQTVNCTFNNKPNAILKINKTTTNSDGTFTYNIYNSTTPFRASASITTSSNTGSTQVAIDPGQHIVVTENSQTGWKLNSNSCSGPFTINKNSSTISNETTIGTATWVNPSAAASSDDSHTTANLSDTNNSSESYAISNYLQLTNFGFNIPSNSIIKGIEIEIERKGTGLNNGNVVDNKISIVKDGRIGLVNRAHLLEFWGKDDATTHYGSGTDLWGVTLKPGDINSAEFGVVISAGLVKDDNTNSGSATANIDNVKVTVTYIREIGVAKGETVECTFRNSKTSLKIIQNVVGLSSSSTSGFAIPSFYYFILPTPLRVNVPYDNSSSNSTEVFLNPGIYSLAQNSNQFYNPAYPTIQDEWIFSGSCDDGTSITSGLKTISNISLVEGETTTCTITNTAKGKLKIKVMNDAGTATNYYVYFDISPTPLRLSASDSPFLAPGSYTINQVLPTGLSLRSASCDNGTYPNFTISSGETTTCTFNNTDHGTLKIIANTGGEAGQVNFKIKNLNSPSSITGLGVTTDSTGTGSLEVHFKPSSYSIEQADSSIWSLISSSCASNFNISYGQTVTCTFNFVKKGTLAIIVNNTGGSSNFIFQISPTPLTISTGSQGAGVSLDPGQYTINEVIPTGWSLVSADCDNGTYPNFNIISGEITRCTFNNSKNPITTNPPLCPRLQCEQGICKRCVDPARCLDNCQNINGQCTLPNPSPNTYGSGTLELIAINPGSTTPPSLKVFDGRSSTGISVSSGSSISLPSMAAGSEFNYNYISYMLTSEVSPTSNIISSITCTNPMIVNPYSYNPSNITSGSVSAGFRILDGKTTTCVIKSYEIGYININVQSTGGDGEFAYGASVASDNPYTQFPYLSNQYYSGFYPGSSVKTVNGSGSVKIPVTSGIKYYVWQAPTNNINFLAGFILDSASCGSGTFVENGVKDVVVSSGGQSVTCNFNNHYTTKGKIKITTQATGGDGTFNYTINESSSSRNVSVETASGTGSSQTLTINSNPTFDTNIQTSLPDGWKEDSFTCNQYTTTLHTPGTITNETTGNYPGLNTYIKTTNFGFSIPGNAIINNVNVIDSRVSDSPQIIYQYPAGLGPISYPYALVKNGLIKGDAYASYSVFGLYYGRPSYAQYASLTPADVNSSGFGIAIPTNLTAYYNAYNYHPTADNLSISITYSLPQTPTSPAIPVQLRSTNLSSFVTTSGKILSSPGQTLNCISKVSYDPDKDSRINLGLSSSKDFKIFNNSTDKSYGDNLYNYNIINSLIPLKIDSIKTIDGSGSKTIKVKSKGNLFYGNNTYYSAYISQSGPSTWYLKDVSCMTSNKTTHSSASIENDSSTGSVSWEKPSDATYTDSLYATAKFSGSGDTSNYLKATNFGFNIPKNAVVKGIEVNVKKNGTQINGGVLDNNVRLVKNDAIQSTNKKDSTGPEVWQPSDYNTATYGGGGFVTSSFIAIDSKYGGSDDLWGSSLTADDVNSKDFGVAISAKFYQDNSVTNSATASINQITMTVYYEVSGANIDPKSNIISCTFTNKPNTCQADPDEEGNRYKFTPELHNL